MDLGTLVAGIEIKDDYKGQLTEAKGEFEKVGDSTEKIGPKWKASSATIVAGATATAAAVGVVGSQLYAIGETFDSVSDTIRVNTGATGEELDSLVESAKTVGTTVPSSFEDVSVAISLVNKRLDATGKPLEDLTAQFLNLSRITGTDITTNIEDMSRVFANWNIVAGEQPETLDKIFRASQQTGIGFGDLTQQLIQFGNPLRELGFSFDQSIAMLGRFEKEGVNSEVVLGAMKKALSSAAKGAGDLEGANLKVEQAQVKLNEAINKYGQGSLEARDAASKLETAQHGVEQATGTTKDIFLDYTEKIKNAGSVLEANAIAGELFGAKAGPEMAAAIRSGQFAIDDLATSISTGSDTINQAAEDTADAAEGWVLWKNKVLTAIEPVAGAVFNTAGSIINALNSTVGPMAQVVSSIALVSTTTGMSFTTMALNAMKSTISVITAAAIHIGQWIAMAATALVNAAIIAGAWLIAIAPIALVIAAIVGLAILIYKYWDEIWAITKKVWGAIWDFIKSVGTWISEAVKAMIDFVVNLFLNWTIVGLVIKHWDKIKEVITSTVSAIINFVKELPGKILEAIKDFGEKLYTSMKDGAKRMIQGIIDGIIDMINSVKNAIGKVTGAIRDALPFSPAKWGPLSGSGSPELAGHKIGTMLSNGLRSSLSEVQQATEVMLGGINLSATATPTPVTFPTNELQAAFKQAIIEAFDKAKLRLESGTAQIVNKENTLNSLRRFS